MRAPIKFFASAETHVHEGPETSGADGVTADIIPAARGGDPERSVYRIAPMANISAEGPWASPRSISGAEKAVSGAKGYGEVEKPRSLGQVAVKETRYRYRIHGTLSGSYLQVNESYQSPCSFMRIWSMQAVPTSQIIPPPHLSFRSRVLLGPLHSWVVASLCSNPRS